MHAIVQCPKCFRHTVAKLPQKTRQCPYCGARINVEKYTRATAPDAISAAELVKKFNLKLSKQGLDQWFKK